MHRIHIGLFSLLLSTTAAFAQDAHDLRVSSQKGATAWFHQETKMEQAIDMGGQAMDMASTSGITFQLTVKDVDEKGQRIVEAKIARVRGAMTLPMMGEVEFDSASPEEGDGKDAGGDEMGMPDLGGIGRAMGTLKDKVLTATVGANGRIVSIDGIDAAIADARKKAGPMLSQMLGGQLNEGVLERMVSGAFGPRAETPVAVKGTWKQEETPKGGRIQAQVKLQLTLQGASAEAFDVEAQGTIEKAAVDAKAPPAAEGEEEDDEARQMMDKMKISNGKTSGTVRISRQDGMVLESTSKNTMDIEAPSPMGGDMAIAMTTTTTMKRTTAEAAAPAKPAAAGDGK